MGTPAWYRAGRNASGIRRLCLRSSICGGLSYIGVNGCENKHAVQAESKGRDGALLHPERGFRPSVCAVVGESL
jgi:hypothetical protein